MNSLLAKVLTISPAVLGLCLAGNLAAQDSGFYAKVDVGPTWMQDATLKSFPGVAGERKVRFDPGGRLTIGGGYKFAEWFGVELETGVAGNEIDSVSGGANLDDAFIVNVPVMANAVFECHRCGNWVPFIGGGGGISSTVLDADVLDVNGSGVHGSDADVVGAWQGFAGVRYNINKHWSVGVAYRYLGTSGAEWDVRDDVADIRMSALHTHSVTAGFVFRF